MELLVIVYLLQGREESCSCILTVLERTYPIASGLGNIFTDLLWRQTERTNFGSESSRSTNFTTSGSQVAARKKPPQSLANPSPGGTI